jgi:hypothetical protein
VQVDLGLAGRTRPVSRTVCRCVAGAAFALLGCSTVPVGLHRGENLQVPFPPPEEGWAVRSGTAGRDDVTEWIRAEGRQVFGIRVMHSLGEYPASRFRAASDTGARESCRSLTSRSFDEVEITGYATEMWLGECELLASGTTRSVLHLYIAGRDSGYYLYRSWEDRPTADQIETWASYFRSVLVCDTRSRRQAPCPEAEAPRPP